MSEEIDDLLARLRAATVADRELDAAIMRLFTSSVESDDGDWWFGPHDQPPQRVPPFTGSLDAALTLLGDGHHFGLLVDNDTYWAAKVRRADGGYIGSGSAPTPALALCIAALEARRA